jgi:hypothetical protein
LKFRLDSFSPFSLTQAMPVSYIAGIQNSTLARLGADHPIVVLEPDAQHKSSNVFSERRRK